MNYSKNYIVTDNYFPNYKIFDKFINMKFLINNNFNNNNIKIFTDICNFARKYEESKENIVWNRNIFSNISNNNNKYKVIDFYFINENEKVKFIESFNSEFKNKYILEKLENNNDNNNSNNDNNINKFIVKGV